MPVGRGHVGDGGLGEDAGVVHEHVEAPVLLDDRVDELPARLLVRDVACHSTGVCKARDGLLGPLEVEVDGNDLGSVLAEGTCDGAPNATGAAGDDDDLALKGVLVVRDGHDAFLST